MKENKINEISNAAIGHDDLVRLNDAYKKLKVEISNKTQNDNAFSNFEFETEFPPINDIEDECEKKDKKKKNKNDYCKWIVGSNNQFIPTTEIEFVPELEPGRYKISPEPSSGKMCFFKKSIESDELLDLPNPVFKQVLGDMEYFWNHQDLFEKYNYIYKRGILLYGGAGCGKSSLCTLLSKQVINKGGIVITINNIDDLQFYNAAISSTFRVIQPNTKILTIFEDLDALVRYSDAETMLLNILDGNNQINNVVNIGCTNYPENLKDRILNRPSRFDRRYEVTLPTPEVRECYLRHKIKQSDYDDKKMKMIVDKTEGLTLAHLGEFIKSVFIFGKDIDETINILVGMNKFITSKSSMESGNKVGFK